jgi:hypothetical protein
MGALFLYLKAKIAPVELRGGAASFAFIGGGPLGARDAMFLVEQRGGLHGGGARRRGEKSPAKRGRLHVSVEAAARFLVGRERRKAFVRPEREAMNCEGK